MLPDNVVQARNAATEYTQKANTSAAAEPTISDVLRQKITEAYSSNQDIVKPLDVATQDYLGAPAAGREKYQNIFNPFQRENLVSQYQGNKALPMLSLSNILGSRMGSQADQITAGTNAFKSQVLAAQAKAQQANDLYTALLDEYKTTETIKSQQEADKLAREKFNYDKTQGPGGGDVLSSLLPLLLGQIDTPGGEQSQYEEPPMSTQQVGLEKEWPVGSGVIWVSDGQGGWN